MTELAGWLWLLVAALGLNLVAGHAGQPMLGQGAFVAFGGYASLLLADRAGWPLGLAVVAAAAGAGLVGWLAEHGAARLRGPYLALATWAAAWLAYAVLVAFPSVFGGEQGLVRPAPARLVSRFLGVEWRVTPAWHVALAATACGLGLLAIRFVLRGPVGLDLAALRQGEPVAASLGVPVGALRRGCLAAAAALGALSGAGTMLLHGLVAPSDVSPLLSVQLYAAVLLGAAAPLFGPVAGVAVLAALPTLADRLTGALGWSPERARGVVTAVLLVLALAAATRIRPPAVRAAGLPPGEPERHPGLALNATGLVKSYGALRALDGVDLDVRPGEVHALVGPNGSGKTTALRVLAGAVRPDAGRIEVGGRDVTRGDQRERVRAGIARTFQRTVLFPGLTVAAQVGVGARATQRGGLARPLLRTPSWRRSLRPPPLLGLPPEAMPETLPYGDQRLLQVARAAATGAGVLLLDEPAAGMSAAERRRLEEVIRGLAGNGTAVLIVEHDMRLVGAVADRVTVLAAGRVLATGSPEQVRRDPAVHEAYLGVPR
jgi:branched-chain amino acid transport system permease protein